MTFGKSIPERLTHGAHISGQGAVTMFAAILLFNTPSLPIGSLAGAFAAYLSPCKPRSEQVVLPGPFSPAS